jgi:hypothetical protein
MKIEMMIKGGGVEGENLSTRKTKIISENHDLIKTTITEAIRGDRVARVDLLALGFLEICEEGNS